MSRSNRSPALRLIVALTVVLLSMPAMAVMLWRTIVALPIVPSAEQLNIATFVIARQNPGYLAGDFTYGSSNPSRFYTPLQIDLFEAFWRSAESIQGAIAMQAVLIVVATMAVAGLSVYFLTHRIVPSLVVAAAAINYRAVLSAGDIWGLGPSWAVLPRAWAAVLVFGVVALWLRATAERSLRYHVLSGLLAGATVNIHPPTGAPLAAAIVGVVCVHALADRGRWREAIAVSGACTLGALPFVVGYMSSITTSVPIDFDQFMAAARLRVEASVLPDVLETLTRSVTPGTDSFVVNSALAIGVVIASVATRPESDGRTRLRELALLSALLLAVSVVFPLAAQAVLMSVGRSPIPTIDLFRGIRLLVPIAMVASGQGMAAALASTGWRQLLAVPICGLILIDADTVESIDKAGVWAILLASLAALALTRIPALRHRPGWAQAMGVALLVVVLPLSGATSFAWRVGSSCCVVAAQPATERTTDELIAWVRSLPENTVFETSAVFDNAAMRLRIETKHGVTWIAKDGNVLLYTDPSKLVLWGARANRARELISRRDIAGLRSTANDYGASLVVVDRLIWPDSIAGANVTATWSGIANPTANDWVGVYAVGQPDVAAYRLAANVTGGSPSGMVGLTISGLTFDGTYEIRLFSGETGRRLAVSSQFQIVGGNATIGPASLTPVGPSLSAGWSGITIPVFQNDRFTVFRP